MRRGVGEGRLGRLILALIRRHDASAAVGVYSGGIHFLAPVVIGHLVDVDARIVYTSRHSMHLSTQVWTADPRTPAERMLTTQCLSVFVVPGADGVARPVPQWTPELPEDVRLQEHVREIMRLSRADPADRGIPHPRTLSHRPSGRLDGGTDAATPRPRRATGRRCG